MAPSSMTKIMTALLIIEAIKSGRLKPSDQIKITRAMLRTRGSRLKPRRGAKISVLALMEAMIVGSANDAAKALAIHLAGSEAAFAVLMSKRGRGNWAFRPASFAMPQLSGQRSPHVRA